MGDSMEDQLILAIETATATARVAILDGGGVVRAAREETAERHSANLLRLCDLVLRDVGVAPAALAAIACGAGPGSFTGLRVGLAVGKGLALPSGRPFLLVSSLATLALDIFEAGRAGDVGDLGDPDVEAGATVIAAPCIDAGKGQIYAGFFRADAARLVVPLADEWVLDPGALAAAAPPEGALWVAGNGAVRHAAAIDVALAALAPLAPTRARARRLEVAGPSAGALGRLALLRLARGESDSLESAVPSYGRPPDITRPRRG
jgi:tRNA threonylcarbamoyladenosine biosynthesis protein TsaB